MSQEPTSLPQPSSPYIPLAQTDQDESFAPVICYSKAGEVPRRFNIFVKKKFFSLVDDFDFLNETAFLEVPFKIFDSMAGHSGQFISIAPSAFWLYPSPINPFYLVKDGRIQNRDCPDLQYYINILLGIAKDFDQLPDMRSSSPLPPSSPPGPPPTPAIEYAEKATQTVEAQAVQPKKRKASEVAEPTEKVRKTAKFEVNLHIHCGKNGRSPKKGMGHSVHDPIVI